MPNDLGQHTEARVGPGTWPQKGEQARYQLQSEYPPLVNASFTIGPWVPFSFDWALREEMTAQGTVWSPRSMSAGDAQYTQALSATAPHLTALEDSQPAALMQEAIDLSAADLWDVFGRVAAGGVFDAKIEVPGEIASEMLALDPEIMNMLEGADDAFKDNYWTHLGHAGDLLNVEGAAEAVLGYQHTGRGAKEFLDKSPLSPGGLRSLQVYLSAFEQLGIPRSVLKNVIGGEETVDVDAKRVSGEIKSKMGQVSRRSPPGTVQTAINEVAQDLQDVMNSFIQAEGDIGREQWLGNTFPKEMTAVQPSAFIGQGNLTNTFEYWTSVDGPIGRRLGGKPTRPTAGVPKALGEIRQLLKRTIQMAIMGDAAQSGAFPEQGSWYYQVPMSMGYAAIFFISPTWSGQIQVQNGLHIIPNDLEFNVSGYAIQAAFGQELSGSMDAILFAAGVQAGAWGAEYMNEFIHRRNVHLGAFSLLYQMQNQDWDNISTAGLHTLLNDSMFPAMTVLGPGTPASRLTPASFSEIIRKELTNFSKDARVIGGVNQAIENAVVRTNALTNIWKNQFIQAVGANRRSDFDYESGGPYGAWTMSDEALQGFMGRGIAMSPMFGFDQSNITAGAFESALATLGIEGSTISVRRAMSGMQGRDMSNMMTTAGSKAADLGPAAKRFMDVGGEQRAAGERHTPDYLTNTPNFLEAGLYR